MMTRTLYAVLFFASAAAPTFAQEARWQLQNSGVTNDLGSVSLVNDQLGFAVGNKGIILRTKDGGKNGQTVLEAAKEGREWNYVQFSDPRTGWCADNPP